MSSYVYISNARWSMVDNIIHECDEFSDNELIMLWHYAIKGT